MTYDQNWYAVCLASEIDDGAVVGADVLGGRVAVYRKSDGSPVVLSSVCPHMGADLAGGDVQGDDLRCMFHFFRFGPDGSCTGIPSDDHVPQSARVHSFPAAERLGLIWMFNGDEPLFEVPGLRDYDDTTVVVRARRTDLFPVEPWVIMANSFDYQHLRFVHGFEFEFDDTTVDWGVPYRIEEDMTFETPEGMVIDQRIRVCGTNTVSYVTRGEVDSMGMFTSTPVPGGSQSYYIAATPDTRAADGDGGAAVAVRLDLQEHLADLLLQDDTRAFANMRFREGAFVGADRSLRRYFQWVRQFPKHDPAGWFG
ncbi:MAG TPA: Rieske 2Fe-2S domain-containing protein [Acidimicrobiia bacterium]|nr:Rieske 2Fe-2S domain-containing protein [Acidimicrobiia bacterium]